MRDIELTNEELIQEFFICKREMENRGLNLEEEIPTFKKCKRW